MNGTCVSCVSVRVRQINVSFSILRAHSRARAIFHLILVFHLVFDECQILLSELPYSAADIFTLLLKFFFPLLLYFFHFFWLSIAI